MNASIKNILETYLRRLTNLSGNNRSILLLRLYAEQLMDVQEFSFLNGERSFAIINALIAGKEKRICPVLDSRVEASNDSSRRLKKIARTDRLVFEERGSNDLHVGWPFVRGKFSDGTLVSCPLIFFPVSLEQSNNTWVLKPRKDVGLTFNKSFLLSYAYYNQLELEEELLETNFEDFDPDSTVFRTQVYQLLKDKIELNFNPDNFRDELLPFSTFKRDEFNKAHKNGELKLFPEAVLGMFPQAGSQLVPDYLHLLEQDNFLDLEEFFVKQIPAEHLHTQSDWNFAVRGVKEEKLFLPFQSDAYQEIAIRAMKNGSSIVVQGPPGTGKSQLICNLMADAMASGKRVLLVCQKRAALDVVYERLNEIDLGDFLGLVHDFRDDRKPIFEKIARQIDAIDDFKDRNRSVDVIQTERKFFQISRRIDQLVEELEEFRQALFDEKECGLSVKELYLTSLINEESINIKQEYQYFKFYELPEFIRKLNRYANYAVKADIEGYPWRHRKSFAELQLSDRNFLIETVESVRIYQAEITEELREIIPHNLNLAECESLLAREDDILGMISALKNIDTYSFFQNMIDEDEDETSLLWFSNIERVFMNCYNDEGPEASIPANQLGKFQLALQQRMQARKSLIKRIRWEFFSEDKFWVKRVLVANNLEYNKTGMRILEAKIDDRLNLEHHITGLRAKEWLKDFPVGYDAAVWKKWFENQKLAIRAKLIFNTVREIRESIHVQSYNKKEFIELFKNILRCLQGIPEKRKDWLYWITSYQITQLINNPSLEAEFVATIREDFDELCEFDRLIEELRPYEKEVIIRLHDKIKEWDPERLTELFQQSLRLAWIEHIETKNPILRTASSQVMSEMQSELQHLVAEKQKLSKNILTVRARERVYEEIEYNRLNNRVTYRDLHHQVTKKKKVWPLRKVIAEFSEELFRIVPCWLASPESVSAIFPMQEMFDLVIFDEASQCFAERGIPAMYRGKQILVAGDNKQLRPSELYQVRWEEETDTPELELDSLLELSERYLPTTMLQGHYRSQALELIDFSNKHFYNGQLKLLPDREIVNQTETAITYCKVDGIWENNINRIEAEQVVTTVIDLLCKNSVADIGIVTFNAPQQMLIWDLLDEAAVTKGIAIPDSLFVKNIENVQGDEKDIIIFSIGYAPDEKGKMMMQFGSLNVAGGDNRLNVAVTRARKKIILITSIFPEQLRVEETKNEGPKLLKSYLQYAKDTSENKFVSSVKKERENVTWYLSKQIKAWGDQQQGFSLEDNMLPYCDVNVSKEEVFFGAIQTDDARYFESPSVKDAYAFVPSLLEEKNWRYRMVFSRSYWQNPKNFFAELERFIQ